MSLTGDGRSSMDSADQLTACGETLAVVRKKALLRILARREAERAGLNVTDADIAATLEKFCHDFGLAEQKELSRWLAQQQLSEAGFAKAMLDFTIVRLLEQAYAGQIDELVPDHIAISTARFRGPAV